MKYKIEEIIGLKKEIAIHNIMILYSLNTVGL